MKIKFSVPASHGFVAARRAWALTGKNLPLVRQPKPTEYWVVDIDGRERYPRRRIQGNVNNAEIVARCR